MSLEYVKSLTVDNEQVEKIYAVISQRLIGKLAKIKATDVPIELEWIVDEATIRRFNRIGSEGMKSESVEGHSVTYDDAEDALAPYEHYIKAHIEEHTNEPPRRGFYFV